VLAPGRSVASLAEHAALAETIAAGDREAAEAAMRRHLTHVGEALLEVSSAEAA
jgi:DNA-binding FadR family transcriptional regulator